MVIMAWKNEYSANVREWDNHHRRIIDTINELHEAMSASKEEGALEGILNNLTNYADFHFNEEEKEMLKHSYPDYTEHRYKHQKMLSNVKALKGDYKQGEKVYPTIHQLFCVTGSTNISQELIKGTASL